MTETLGTVASFTHFGAFLGLRVFLNLSLEEWDVNAVVCMFHKDYNPVFAK